MVMDIDHYIPSLVIGIYKGRIYIIYIYVLRTVFQYLTFIFKMSTTFVTSAFEYFVVAFYLKNNSIKILLCQVFNTWNLVFSGFFLHSFTYFDIYICIYIFIDWTSISFPRTCMCLVNRTMAISYCMGVSFTEFGV